MIILRRSRKHLSSITSRKVLWFSIRVSFRFLSISSSESRIAACSIVVRLIVSTSLVTSNFRWLSPLICLWFLIFYYFPKDRNWCLSLGMVLAVYPMTEKQNPSVLSFELGVWFLNTVGIPCDSWFEIQMCWAFTVTVVLKVLFYSIKQCHLFYFGKNLYCVSLSILTSRFLTNGIRNCHSRF